MHHPSQSEMVEEERGTDMGAPLGEDPGPEGEPGQKLRLAVTSMGGYWRVDVFGEDGFYKTWDCNDPNKLGGALAEAYGLIRGIAP